MEQLPSGSWRARVYAGVDPLTRREIRLPETCGTERAAQIALGKLLEQAAVGRQPESNVTVATLVDEYAAIAEWELSTREAQRGLYPPLPEGSYLFSNDPKGMRRWNPDWATHKAGELAAAAGVKLTIKGLRHYTRLAAESRGEPAPARPGVKG